MKLYFKLYDFTSVSGGLQRFQWYSRNGHMLSEFAHTILMLRLDRTHVDNLEKEEGLTGGLAGSQCTTGRLVLL